jgi:hypothetical protein
VLASIPAAPPIETVLQALEARDCRPRGNAQRGWDAHCPAHDDRRQSLTIDVKDDGRVLLKCHASCTAEAFATHWVLSFRPCSNGT